MSVYGKPDYWSLQAKTEGYPARSVYKLQEMDARFGLFSGASKASGGPVKVLDLGAAPGSWSLYARRHGAQGRFILGVDISPLSPHCSGELFAGEGYGFLQGDMTAAETRTAILAHAPFHLVLSDAAPGTSGNPGIDTLRSLVLAEAALEYADLVLHKGGHFVVKVFQGGEAPRLLKAIRERFKTGRSFKPRACRRTSFETYYLGLGKKQALPAALRQAASFTRAPPDTHRGC
ncbi:MAG: RlmE family RNA methyltransferase [Treponema sp.]|jgi:23S rRNA (uridine2552-2'-O)-methyltransferase|nr:RlmE family RNA methyltransferase [Treponema sp.]